MNLELITHIDRLLATFSHRRISVAIAGPPTAGKSTLAQQLHHYYQPISVILPIDGFHLDNELLVAHNLKHRKGSPETFNVNGFFLLIQRVLTGDNCYAPSFDRALDLSRANAIEIHSKHRLIIIEGNYLLFNEKSWRPLANLWDLSIWLDIPMDWIKKRSQARWLKYGLSRVEAEFNTRYNNDINNAKRIINNRLVADYTINNLSV
ncbi:MAG: hypothetical protein ACWIPH_05490 [Ostreibacterium sp.]